MPTLFAKTYAHPEYGSCRIYAYDQYCFELYFNDGDIYLTQINDNGDRISIIGSKETFENLQSFFLSFKNNMGSRGPLLEYIDSYYYNRKTNDFTFSSYTFMQTQNKITNKVTEGGTIKAPSILWEEMLSDACNLKPFITVTYSPTIIESFTDIMNKKRG